jgi:hypothetical protein
MKVASGPFLCSIRQPFLRPDLRVTLFTLLESGLRVG